MPGIVVYMESLERLIARLRHLGSDTPNVEVKSAHGGLPESVDETLCSFGNLPGGGLLILGLDETKGFAAVGLRDAALLAAGLVSKARQVIDPPLNVSVNVEVFEGADLVVAQIHEVDTSAKPCRVKRSGKAYLRFADGDYTLSQLEIDGFIANRTRPKFDEAEVPEASVEDLDHERLADFLVTARNLDRRLAPINNDTELLLKTGVISRSKIPTVAGLLALGAYPQQFLRYFTIRAALLPADARQSTRALDSATFTGPVGAMLKATKNHPWRPAHLHFMIDAPGYERLITHVFRDHDQYLDSDVVFGVRQSLVADWVKQADGTYSLHYDFVLNPTGGA